LFLVRRLKEWIRREVRAALKDEMTGPRIQHEDPLRCVEDHRSEMETLLRGAANIVGAKVIVGQDVILWGGKFAGGVGLELHDHVRIYDQCRLVIDQVGSASGIVLEERVAMNFGCYLDGSGGVRIRKRTILGPNVVIVSSSHRIDPNVAVQNSGKNYGPVDIGEDVWIGAGAVIRMGIKIGDRAVIGAGSIVTHDVPADAVVAGNPARVLRPAEASHGPHLS
jgi:acetyltransferase-like isoleucine patch superfamily enzyme